MRDIELIPNERDKKSAEMYKFMDWFLRKHRKLIGEFAKNAIFLMMAYGEEEMDKMFDDYLQERLK